MWKAFLFLACVAGYITIVSCDGETNTTGETKPITGPDGLISNGRKGCGCYPPICRINEVYYNCSGGCIPRRCSEIGFPLNCDKKCTPGCVCKDGYVRAENGTCIPISECPSCGGDKNAQQGCGNNCGHTCSAYNKPPKLCPIGCIFNGCNCRKGYVYDNNVKACVKPEDCTPTCGLNEVYSSCTNGVCGHTNCSQLGQHELCIDRTPESCTKGCICVSGYLRDDNGTCVPQDNCPAAGCGGDPNAQPGCGYNCGKTCTTYKTKHPFCPGIVCKPIRCDCKDGYVFDGNVNKCVLPQDCTPICQVNEEYSSCVNGGCDARNCSQNGKLVPCVKLDPKYCIKGCICIEGYLRAANGTCVPKDQCTPKCDKPNEVYDVCPAPCPPKRCNVNEAVIKCAAPPKPGDPDCQPGCRCADNYYRNATGTCVPKKKCEKPLICDRPNEIYDACGITCPPQECGINPAAILCLRPPEYGDPACKPSCICIDGYVRNDEKECIPKDKCRCGNDPNAHRGCGVNCGRTCSTYKTKNVACILICNLNGCDCNDGYVFDPNVKKCVLPEDCTPTCGLNEVYSSCTNVGCSHRNCSQLGRPQLCIDRLPEFCTKGCICASGYLRADNGTCVPQDKCPSAGCGGDPNAQPGCGYNCGKTCTTYKTKHPLCPRIPCKLKGCDCKDGYVFDGNVNKCVLPQDCITCGINEVYDVCPAPCPPRRCDVDDRLIRCAAPPQPGDPACKPGCRCADGYARNATGTCVLREQCEPRLNCDQPNELYDSCPALCPGDSCAVDPRLVLCAPSPKYGDPECKPACRCIDGYARNAANECVPRDQCPSKKCPGQNEFLDTCISGCSNQSCDSIGKIFNCPIQPAVCRTGCRCKPGFYRNASNVCVSESLCPTPPCPEDEVYSRCPTVKCEGDYCPKNRDSPHTCPVGIICDPPRCVCGLLDRRDRKTGKCIRAYNCPPFKCDGPNEEYQSCPATCPGEKCTDYINNAKCPAYRIGIVVPCKPQCRCKKGYYRNSDGICILACQCERKKTTSTTPATPVIDQRDNLEAGISVFNGKFLYNRMKASPGENIITSPCSVITLLAQLALYTIGESWKQLSSILNLTSKQDIRKTIPSWADSFNGQTSVNFSTAAKVYSNQQYPLSDGFKKDSVDVLRAEAQEIDFSKNNEAAATINAWVESKTNNRIKDLIAPSDISGLTRLVLVNAIYFKGDWEKPFNKNYTRDADFYLSDGKTKKTKLMFQEGYFNYGESPELNCSVLEIPYKGRNFSMIIVLPNEKDGILRTTENLQDAANFDHILGSIRSNKVKVYVPPFEINTSTDLATILKQGGVTKIFDPKDSGLSGMLKSPDDFYVSKAIQKAFVKVDETGSEAAAANAIVVGTTAAITPPRNIVFRCDRSFLYYIAFRRTVLFSGALVNPN